MRDKTISLIIQNQLDSLVYSIKHATSEEELNVYKQQWRGVFETLKAFSDYYDTSVGGVHSPQSLGNYLIVRSTSEAKYYNAIVEASERLQKA